MAAPQLPVTPTASAAEILIRDRGTPSLAWDDANQCYKPPQVDDLGNLKINGTLTASPGSGLPYAADQQVIAYYGATNNIQTITYKKAGVTLKTRTFTYAGGGASNNDALTGTIDA